MCFPSSDIHRLGPVNGVDSTFRGLNHLADPLKQTGEDVSFSPGQSVQIRFSEIFGKGDLMIYSVHLFTQSVYQSNNVKYLTSSCTFFFIMNRGAVAMGRLI